LKATLARRKLIADDTFELDFDLGGDTIGFTAGQYCRITLAGIEAGEKDSRKFTIVNAPHDNGHLVVATRTGTTGYKRTMCSLPPGATAEIGKVKGKLTLPEEVSGPLVFVAGGIGIVPFVSMLRDLAHRDPSALGMVTMLYFNRGLAAAAYREELEQMAAEHPGLAVIMSMTRDESWSGERGRLGRPLLERVVGKPGRHVFYVVGTPGMVKGAVKTLTKAGVDKKRIRDEDFSGYEDSAT
jgi:ferredoxin-NADP reductase